MKRLAEQWYELLLRVLPRALRDGFAADMRLTFEARLSERRRRVALFVLRESAAVVRFAVAERLACRPHPITPRKETRMDALTSNLRAAVRTALRSPGFTAAAVLTLGIGIGLTAAIFSALDAVLLRPSPYANVDELVNVERPTGDEDLLVPWPHPQFELLRGRTGPFSDAAAYGARKLTLTGWGEPARLNAELVSDNYLRMLGLAPVMGRSLSAESHIAREVLISHRAWRERFGGGDVLGRPLQLNGGAFTIVGVLPPGIYGESGEADLWLPVELAPDVVGDPTLLQPYVMWLNVIARLRPGVTPALAQEQLMVMNDALVAEGKFNLTIGERPLNVRPLHGSRIEPAFRRALVLTFGAAGLLMFMVCINISSLLLVRTQGRERELALRRALGASRARLAGQLMAESLMIAVLAGIVGLLIANGALVVLTALRPSPTPGFWAGYARALDVHEFRLDARVFGFTCALTLFAGILSGLIPALRAHTTDFASRLRGGGGNELSGGRGWSRARVGMVAIEIALAFVLTAGAGLVAASLAQMQRERLGFDAEAVTTMLLGLPSSTHTRQQAAQFYAELLRRVSALPGVGSASLSSGLPVTRRGGTTDFVPENYSGSESLTTIDVAVVSSDYFRTMVIPIRTGRPFDPGTAGPFPIVISAAAANRYWPGENPIGYRAHVYVASGTKEPLEIVGVAEDVQYHGIGDEIGPMVYLPVERVPARSLYVNVRSSAPPSAVAAALRAEVRRLDSSLAITEIRTMHERVVAATSRARFSAVLISVFAGIAALLAVLGVYGLVSQVVRQRTREFGVRLALGGQPRGIIATLLRDVTLISMAGVLLGLAGSMALAQVVQSQLYGVTATDPRLLGGTAIAMILAAAVAAWLPALRVLRISASAELMRD